MREKSYHIITFGCQMNVHDSQWLAKALQKRNFSEASLEEAQVVVINTCSVREKPEQKVLSALGRVRQATKNNPNVLVAVTGCVAQQLGESLFRQPQVRLVAGSDGIANAPQALEELLAEPDRTLSLLDFTSHYVEREEGVRVSSGPVAYVNIMQGCDNFCAYCIVPYTRGRQKSRSTEAILRDCQNALEDGARELCLLGQNVNAFGQDAHGDGTSFASLLRKVAALPSLQRLRYVTPHPKDMTVEDIALFQELPTLCPRLHLPLQAGSDAVLARMGRKYDRQRYGDIVRALRAARPDIALSTDLIVGFPGEEEHHFQETLRMMEDVGFMSSFSFAYSDRPGTRASRFLDKIAPEVQQDRLLRLQEVQERLSQAWLDARIGQETEILLEGPSRRDVESEAYCSWQGRDPYGALVHVALPRQSVAMEGKIVRVRIEEAKKHSLVARATGDIW